MRYQPPPEAVINAAIRLAVEAEKVCGALAGDKLVDGLRAALRAFGDVYDERVHR